MMKVSRILFIAVMFASLFAFACGGDENKNETWMGTPKPTASDTANTSMTDTASGTLPGSPGGTALVPDVAAGATLLVMLNDNSIALPAEKIGPGPVVLTVQNQGTEVHNLFVEGEGISKAAGDPIEVGKASVMDLTLKPGTYTLYCPILDHRTRGEQATLTIEQP